MLVWKKTKNIDLKSSFSMIEIKKLEIFQSLANHRQELVM